MRPLLPLVLLAACQPFGPMSDDAAPALLDGVPPAEGALNLHGAPGVVTGEYLVRLPDGVGLADPALTERLAAVGASTPAPTGNPSTFRFHSDADPDAIARVAELGGWVEPVVRLVPQSADPAFPYQWHHPMLRTEEAWAWNRGAGVVVAVIDTGVLRVSELGLANADGIEHLLPAEEYLPVEPVWISTTASISIPNDDVGHGTHIASTIAQRADNGFGGAGIAPDATILPIRALGQQGGDSDVIAQAIRSAADQGAQVINLSLGGPLYSEVLAEACQYAHDQGALVIAASGNDGDSNYVSWPAALETVLAVGAVGADGSVADYSNRGAALDLVAPGGAWYDWTRDGMFDGVLAETWMYWQGVEGVQDGAYVTDYFLVGTSMATATVSGVAALLAAEGATADEIRDVLQATAVDVGAPGWDEESGFGLIDAAAALEAFAGPAPEPSPEPEPEPVVLTLADVATGELAVTELMADPTVCANDDCEWIEVENRADAPVDLAGLRLTDASGNLGTIAGPLVIEAGGLLVLGRGAAAGWAQPDFVPAAFYGTALSLNNSGDVVILSGPNGEISRTLSYGSSSVSPGVSLVRVGADPADPAAWVESDTLGVVALPLSGEVATPGAR